MAENKMYPFQRRDWRDDLTAEDRAHLKRGGSIDVKRDAQGAERKVYVSPEEARRRRAVEQRITGPIGGLSNAQQRALAAERAAFYQRELALVDGGSY